MLGGGCDGGGGGAPAVGGGAAGDCGVELGTKLEISYEKLPCRWRCSGAGAGDAATSGGLTLIAVATWNERWRTCTSADVRQRCHTSVSSAIALASGRGTAVS